MLLQVDKRLAFHFQIIQFRPLNVALALAFGTLGIQIDELSDFILVTRR